MHLNGPLENSAVAAPADRAPARRSISFRWAVQDNSLQMFPPVPKRSFKWSYVLARALRRLHPRTYL